MSADGAHSGLEVRAPGAPGIAARLLPGGVESPAPGEPGSGSDREHRGMAPLELTGAGGGAEHAPSGGRR
jgi:hypothetical protein